MTQSHPCSALFPLPRPSSPFLNLLYLLFFMTLWSRKILSQVVRLECSGVRFHLPYFSSSFCSLLWTQRPLNGKERGRENIKRHKENMNIEIQFLYSGLPVCVCRMVTIHWPMAKGNECEQKSSQALACHAASTKKGHLLPVHMRWLMTYQWPRSVYIHIIRNSWKPRGTFYSWCLCQHTSAFFGLWSSLSSNWA